MNSQVLFVCRTLNFIFAISKMCRFIDQSETPCARAFWSLVLSWLDYCNSLLGGILSTIYYVCKGYKILLHVWFFVSAVWVASIGLPFQRRIDFQDFTGCVQLPLPMFKTFWPYGSLVMLAWDPPVVCCILLFRWRSVLLEIAQIFGSWTTAVEQPPTWTLAACQKMP